ncbi:MAG: hypothetical protein LBI28_10305 [Treponema sp.]|jgi:hypothetical protein|nr:hypothetical protein [Treponema sp.]
MKKIAFFVIIVNIGLLSISSCATNSGSNPLVTGLSTHYIEFMGLSKLELEKIINSEPIRVVDEMNTYQINPGNNDATNAITFFIDPIKGVYRIVTMHEYSNIWIRDKLNEYTRVFGEPVIRDGNYAFIAKENENNAIIVFVTSGIFADKQYGIIGTMVLEY